MTDAKEADQIEQVARVLCRQSGLDPDKLEPGDLPQIDGRLRNGDPAHFMWRDFQDRAAEIVALFSNT